MAVKCLNPNLLVPDGGMGSISKVRCLYMCTIVYHEQLHLWQTGMCVRGLGVGLQCFCAVLLCRAVVW
jgi:hypothetical protein